VTDDEKLHRLELSLAQCGNTHTVADVHDLVRQQKARFWTNGDGCIVTEINRYPQLSAVHYWLIFGELQACLALEDTINAYALEERCSIATANGRPGWLRAAAPTGWKLHGYSFYKELTGGR